MAVVVLSNADFFVDIVRPLSLRDLLRTRCIARDWRDLHAVCESELWQPRTLARWPGSSGWLQDTGWLLRYRVLYKHLPYGVQLERRLPSDFLRGWARCIDREYYDPDNAPRGKV